MTHLSSEPIVRPISDRSDQSLCCLFCFVAALAASCAAAHDFKMALAKLSLVTGHCGRVLPPWRIQTFEPIWPRTDTAARKIPFNRQTLIPIRVMTYQVTGRGGHRGDTAVLRGFGNYR
jgi:hypothetical protein